MFYAISYLKTIGFMIIVSASYGLVAMDCEACAATPEDIAEEWGVLARIYRQACRNEGMRKLYVDKFKQAVQKFVRPGIESHAVAGLFYALEHKDKAVFGLIATTLLMDEHGTRDARAIDAQGDTLWHIAIRFGMTEVFGALKALLPYPGDTKNKKGQVPGDCSEDSRVIAACLQTVWDPQVLTHNDVNALNFSRLLGRVHRFLTGKKYEKMRQHFKQDEALSVLLDECTKEEREWFMAQILQNNDIEMVDRVRANGRHGPILGKDLEFRAIRYGAEDMVSAMLERRLSASPAPCGETPLHAVVASTKDCKRKLDLLLQDKTQTAALRTRDAHGHTPLFKAIMVEHISNAEILDMIRAYQKHGFDLVVLFSDRFEAGNTLTQCIDEHRPILLSELKKLLDEFGYVGEISDLVVDGVRGYVATAGREGECAENESKKRKK